MYGEVNLWWRKNRKKKEGNVTRLPELYDLFLKMLKRKHQLPMPLIMKKTQFKNSYDFATKIVQYVLISEI